MKVPVYWLITLPVTVSLVATLLVGEQAFGQSLLVSRLEHASGSPAQPEPPLPRFSDVRAFAAVASVDDCIGRGPAPSGVTSLIDLSARPLQREVLQGTSSGAPATGTIVRFYSDPAILTRDFDGSGTQDTVRAITELSGPGGADPCPGDPNGGGCTMGERVVQEPYLSSSGLWTVPADFPFPRSEETIGEYAPRTYELRFTESGSLVYHAFADGRIARFPVEIWDIGAVAPGEANDPADDVRMAVAVFSDGGGQCAFNLDEATLNSGSGSTISDRLYAFYFGDGASYEDFEAAIEAWAPLSEELAIPLTGQVRPCSGGAAGPFGCSGIDLLSYLPIEMLGHAGLNDLWGWEDPVTGKEYVLAGRVDGVAFVDISDPLNPIYVGQLPTPTFATSWRDVKVYQNAAYVVADAAGNGGLQIFDLTRLRSVSNPPETFAADLTTNAFIGDAHNIAVNPDAGFLYGALASGTCGRNGIAMVDVRSPLNPLFSGCMLWNNPAVQVHDLQCVNYHGPDTDYSGREICFTANEQDGLGIADVTDKSSPSEVSRATYPLLQYAHQGWLTEDHQYFVLGDEIDERAFAVNTRTLIWDVADLDDPQLLTVYESQNTATDHNLYVRGSLIYEANYASGLRVIDISAISNPHEVAFFDTYPFDDSPGFDGAWTVYPFFQSGTIAISSRQEGLFLVRLATGVGVASGEGIPSEFSLDQNYPNPFNPVTTISFALPSSSEVRLAVYDLLGREIRVLEEGARPAGRHEVVFDGRGLPSGTYVYRIEAGDYSGSRRLTLVR